MMVVRVFTFVPISPLAQVNKRQRKMNVKRFCSSILKFHVLTYLVPQPLKVAKESGEPVGFARIRMHHAERKQPK